MRSGYRPGQKEQMLTSQKKYIYEKEREQKEVNENQR